MHFLSHNAVVLAAALFIGFSFHAASEPYEPGAQDRRFQFTYETKIDAMPEGAQEVRLWIPMPKRTPFQDLYNIRVETAGEWEVVEEEAFGNRFAAVTLNPDTASSPVRLSFDLVRKTRTPQPSDALTAEETRMYLSPSRLISLEGPVKSEATRVAGNERDEYSIAKLLYDNIVDTVVYDKSGEGWGRGDSQYACDARAGNCTDFHSLFIGEARALGIPARFVMGFPLPEGSDEGSIGGYHCWAEFYVEEKGWVVVDASEAFNHPERREFLFGSLDPNRVQFTKGRDIQVPDAKTESLNYSIYPHVEVDGKLHTTVTNTFSFKNID